MDLDFTGVKDMVSNAAMLPIKVLGEDHATALKQYPRVTSQAWDIFQGLEESLLLDALQQYSSFLTSS